MRVKQEVADFKNDVWNLKKEIPEIPKIPIVGKLGILGKMGLFNYPNCQIAILDIWQFGGNLAISNLRETQIK